MEWSEVVLTPQIESFQLTCSEIDYVDYTIDYEQWCSDKGDIETTIISSELNPLDPTIKEVYILKNKPAEIRWRKDIHINPFLGWKIKSIKLKVNCSLCSTIDHLKLYYIIINKNVDEIIAAMDKARFSKKQYQFIIKKNEREFNDLISKLYQKIEATNVKKWTDIVEFLIAQSPTTFLHLWEHSNRQGGKIQSYMY